MDENTWLPVPGFEGHYEISDDGRLRSLKHGRVRQLRPAPNPQGYLVGYLSVGGVMHRRPVHQLVAAAFLGPRPSGADVRHLDGDCRNNRVDNLAYGTRAENVYDSVDHGTHPQASKTSCKNGHPFDDANTYLRPGRTTRGCRECRRQAVRDMRERRRKT